MPKVRRGHQRPEPDPLGNPCRRGKRRHRPIPSPVPKHPPTQVVIGPRMRKPHLLNPPPHPPRLPPRELRQHHNPHPHTASSSHTHPTCPPRRCLPTRG